MRRGILAIVLILLATALCAEGKPRDWKESAEVAGILSMAEQDAELPRGLAHCVAYSESRFKPDARSRIVDGYRSCGIMQLYRKYLYGPDGIASRFSDNPEAFRWDDPRKNAEVGCRYLSWLIKRYGGSVYLALIAYNWGPTKLSRIERVDEIPPDVIQYTNDILVLLDQWEPCWANQEGER